MKFNKYQKEVDKIVKLADRDKLLLPILWLNEEAGEVSKYLKKAIKYNEEMDKDAIIEEAGDVLNSLSALATGLGISLDDIAEMSLKKLEESWDAND